MAFQSCPSLRQSGHGTSPWLNLERKDFFFSANVIFEGGLKQRAIMVSTPSSCGISSSFLKKDLGSISQCPAQLHPINAREH